VIGITLEQLKQTRRVVGIAGGPEKSPAILGALRGKLINVLITDSLTAEKLLQ
jgi:DNA-binding transcriptional regulator LsrR (DeoR family)